MTAVAGDMAEPSMGRYPPAEVAWNRQAMSE